MCQFGALVPYVSAIRSKLAIPSVGSTSFRFPKSGTPGGPGMGIGDAIAIGREITYVRVASECYALNWFDTRQKRKGKEVRLDKRGLCS